MRFRCLAAFVEGINDDEGGGLSGCERANNNLFELGTKRLSPDIGPSGLRLTSKAWRNYSRNRYQIDECCSDSTGIAGSHAAEDPEGREGLDQRSMMEVRLDPTHQWHLRYSPRWHHVAGELFGRRPSYAHSPSYIIVPSQSI